MYTIEYIVHTYVHKCEYICAYVYPAKENEYTCNNVHVHLCMYMHKHVLYMCIHNCTV